MSQAFAARQLKVTQQKRMDLFDLAHAARIQVCLASGLH
jgi:hypothetical protein